MGRVYGRGSWRLVCGRTERHTWDGRRIEWRRYKTDGRLVILQCHGYLGGSGRGWGRRKEAWRQQVLEAVAMAISHMPASLTLWISSLFLGIHKMCILSHSHIKYNVVHVISPRGTEEE